MFFRKKRIQFKKLKVNAPIVKIKIDDGIEGYAVIDTGSEFTVFDKRFVKRNRKVFEVAKNNSEFRTISLDGQSEPITFASASSKITFDNSTKTCLVNGIISDLSAIIDHVHEQCGKEYNIIMLIGYDILSEIRAVIDLDKNTMEVHP